MAIATRSGVNNIPQLLQSALRVLGVRDAQGFIRTHNVTLRQQYNIGSQKNEYWLRVDCWEVEYAVHEGAEIAEHLRATVEALRGIVAPSPTKLPPTRSLDCAICGPTDPKLPPWTECGHAH